jgi:hypothetical protein
MQSDHQTRNFQTENDQTKNERGEWREDLLLLLLLLFAARTESREYRSGLDDDARSRQSRRRRVRRAHRYRDTQFALGFAPMHAESAERPHSRVQSPPGCGDLHQ